MMGKKKNEMIRLTVPNAVMDCVPPKVLKVELVIKAKSEVAPFLANAEKPTLIIEREIAKLGIKYFFSKSDDATMTKNIE